MRIAACIFAALVSALGLSAGEVPRDAPALELKTTDGRVMSLADLKGKVVAVLWISTDCPHCQETCESFAPIYSEFAGQGFEIMAMAVNPRAPANIDSFKSKHGVKFPIGVSMRSDWVRFADLSVMARPYVPYMMLVDRNGVIRYEHAGRDQAFWSDQVSHLRKELAELLAEPSSASR